MSLRETIEKLPIYKQLVAQAEAKRQQKREGLVARRHEIEAERDQRLPALIQAAQRADAALVKAKQTLRDSQRTRYQAHGAKSVAAANYEHRIQRVDAELQALASEPIGAFVAELDKDIDLLRSPVTTPEEKTQAVERLEVLLAVRKKAARLRLEAPADVGAAIESLRTEIIRQPPERQPIRPMPKLTETEQRFWSATKH